MSKTIAIGPVTRIEGHLDIEVSIEETGGVLRVVDARSAGTMFRGFESLLQRRHPRDAVHITQRVCGICPTSHGLAASMCLEAAYGPSATPPPNGRILRNCILAADFLQSHILHFYQLTLLDYIDADGVLGTAPAQPRRAAPDMLTSADAAGMLAHYAAAMDIRRKTHQLGAIFGGRMPCSPTLVPGGCTQVLSDAGGDGEPTATEKIRLATRLLDEIRVFIAKAYLPDVDALVYRFPECSTIGRGCGNLLAYGGFELDDSGSKKLLPRGVCTDGQAGVLDLARITEDVKHSFYRTTEGQPAAGVDQPEADKPGAYSWSKAPRYAALAYEVGPLARMWIAGVHRRGISVMDRLTARAQEALYIADAMALWLRDLRVEAPTRARFSYARAGTGMGLIEAPRGALGHWMEFTKNAIQSYRILAPTTWNASPMDAQGVKGPIEQALIGTPVRTREQPIELLRVVHSFDPCLACSVH